MPGTIYFSHTRTRVAAIET